MHKITSFFFFLLLFYVILSEGLYPDIIRVAEVIEKLFYFLEFALAEKNDKDDNLTRFIKDLPRDYRSNDLSTEDYFAKGFCFI